jgi:hypothetical protein
MLLHLLRLGWLVVVVLPVAVGKRGTHCRDATATVIRRGQFQGGLFVQKQKQPDQNISVTYHKKKTHQQQNINLIKQLHTNQKTKGNETDQKQTYTTPPPYYTTPCKGVVVTIIWMGIHGVGL